LGPILSRRRSTPSDGAGAGRGSACDSASTTKLCAVVRLGSTALHIIFDPRDPSCIGCTTRQKKKQECEATKEVGREVKGVIRRG